MQWGRPGEMESSPQGTHEMRGRPTWTRRNCVAGVELTPSKLGRQPAGGISSVLEAASLPGEPKKQANMRKSWQE